MLFPLLACGPLHQPIASPPPEARGRWHQAIDWQSASEELANVLAGYLRIDTRNPPGNEIAGATYLASVLRADGIESRIVEHSPGRASLIARLQGSGKQPPLCLESHIDTATWEDDGWPEGKGPLSGAVDDEGILWGRGALDMKGLGAIELMTMVWLRRLGVPLSRDVVLLAVADEEVDNGGARFVAKEHWAEVGCSHMLGEGGIGVRDAFFPGQTVYGVSVAEKGVLWLRMIAAGEPGHGSTPQDGEAPERLLVAMQRLSQRRPQVSWHPATLELLYEIGGTRRGLERAVLTHPPSVRAMLKRRLMGNPATAAMLTDTVHLTGMQGGVEPNVVPAEVAAILDCRTQPDEDPHRVLAELREMFDDLPWLRFEVIAQTTGNGSQWDDPFFSALVRHLEEQTPGAVAGPMVSVGFTDAILFRPLGVRAYGVAPFAVTAEELATMHGNGERVSLENLRRGLRVVFSAVVDVGSDEGGSPPAEPMRAPRRERGAEREVGPGQPAAR